MKALTNICLAIVLLLLSYSAPRIHYQWLRNKVGNKVVKIVNEEGNSGGTGFFVTAPSGKTYILTNAHVCGLKKNGKVYIQETDDAERTVPVQVIEESPYTDLCLVESHSPKKGLSIASNEALHEQVYVVGHPHLMPTTLTQGGELIGETQILVLDHLIIPGEEASCSAPKNKIVPIFIFQGCVIDIKAYLSNIQVLPGNSGSPVVNQFGNVVAVVFAGDDKAFWGMMITLKDIKDFLKPY